MESIRLLPVLVIFTALSMFQRRKVLDMIKGGSGFKIRLPPSKPRMDRW